MVESFQENVTDHLQTLPVIPPPQDITAPEDVLLEWMRDLQVEPHEARKVWSFGVYLEALAMINSRVVPETSNNGCIRFDYRIIPLQQDFGLVREVVYHPRPAKSLSDDDYEEISKRWGFYTLLALCVREVLAFDSGKSSGDRSGLERVRAYLVAERSKLGSNEPIKSQLTQKLLEIVDKMLGKGRGRSLLQKQLERLLRGQ